MEGMPSQENVERDILVQKLKENIIKGEDSDDGNFIEDQETRELLQKWCEAGEQKVEAIGTREAQIRFEIERALLYRDAGLAEEAASALDDALTIAENEGEGALAQEILNLYGTL